MKPVFLLFIVIFVGGSCQNKGSVSTDPQRNRYFSAYNEIYSSWRKIPTDSTRQKLNIYLQEFPENADARMLAGNVAYSLADYPEAMLQYRKAIAQQPDRSIYYSALGCVFNIQDKVDSAEKYLMKAIELGDSSAYTFLGASLLYAKKGEKEQCFAFADSAYSGGHSLPEVCAGLCLVYYQWHEEKKGEELWRKAVVLGLKDTSAFRQVLNGKMKQADYYRINY